MKTLIIIPSRLSASRLPGKPLLKINGISIISHVFKRAKSANIGEVIVAAEDQEIVDDVKSNGGDAILTSKKHKTGTDRTLEAVSILSKKNVDFIMNVQGDEPQIDIDDIKNLDKKMKLNNSKIGTLAAKISNSKFYDNENIVKVKIRESFEKNPFPCAESFFRKTKYKDNIFHHIGVYCYAIDTLTKLISLNQSKNEIENRLEQLRALDNNIDINVALAKSSPIGVDTKEDYMAIKKIMEYK
jgi:3-deoxy-manno-octulosonate cytidylyltransferase (CMP-KDO synthetase)